MSNKFIFSGIIPANLLPFEKDYSIREKDYRRHLSWLADVPGVTAIVCNGHAAEVSSLTREERRRALAIAVEEVGSRVPLISGIYSDSTLEAVDLAKDAKAEGASGLLIFPPSLFMWGAQLRPELVYRHFAAVGETVGLPMVVFQFPPATGIGYSTETLVKLTEIPQVAAVKEFSNDMVVFERNLRAIKATGKPVAILSSYSSSLLSTFILGADGAVSGMGSVAADLQAQLFDAVKKGDLSAARKINDRLDLLVRVFYARPALDQHNRMKEALAMLGRISLAVVRPPLQPIEEEERSKIRAALHEAGLPAT
ncbi:MAG: dihydrodipicolinate synthase family protein [Candidatus Tectomicrobia bacterium]|uniref:Dihydrodipicolinate synthase family protein n=1 Tax=Tectimicrobiota bacterium TaxID=2528274 RepID=A0A933GKW4_UNCTE|nr:dihydrodipicolinate synthase family protein [Candidatus Tectomicrobia bacterium]